MCPKSWVKRGVTYWREKAFVSNVGGWLRETCQVGPRQWLFPGWFSCCQFWQPNIWDGCRPSKVNWWTIPTRLVLPVMICIMIEVRESMNASARNIISIGQKTGCAIVNIIKVHVQKVTGKSRTTLPLIHPFRKRLFEVVRIFRSTFLRNQTYCLTYFRFLEFRIRCQWTGLNLNSILAEFAQYKGGTSYKMSRVTCASFTF